MKKAASVLLFTAVSSTVWAEPTPATAPTPAAPATPAPVPAAPAASTATPAEAPAVDTITLEQRRQMELVSSAERIDKANRELLARNQELQLQNENLTLQNNVLQRDKSSEGIWKGALAVIAGFLMGWYFAGSRRKSGW